jgi:hypothetical protein
MTPDACAPGPDHPIFLYGARTWLVVLHAVASIVLVGASTHHALSMRAWLRGRFPAPRREKRWARVVAVSYVVTFAFGAMLYPTYRYHVRGLYLDRYAPWAAHLFDVKEVYAALALLLAVGLGVLSYSFDPERDRPLVRIYAAMSAIVCAVVWFDVVAGLVVMSVRGIG